MTDHDYNRRTLSSALSEVGLCSGDVVFSHSNVGFFGRPEGGASAENIYATVEGAFRDVLGPDGTLVVPTFTYSFCKRQPFDPDRTASTCGLFTELVRRDPRAIRSCDPIFSVAALGGRAAELTQAAPAACFGGDSFWARLLAADGWICNLNFDAGSTFLHHAEWLLRVPYRYDKLFTGAILEEGQTRRTAAIFFCQDLANPLTAAAFEAFHRLAVQAGIVRQARVGRGSVLALRARAALELVRSTLPLRPWLLTKADGAPTPPVLLSGGTVAVPELPAVASPGQIVAGVCPLKRDIVSDGYDAALQALAKQVPMTIHAYPTGTHAWTWIVPEKWTCHEAWLETMDGRRLFSYADHPLHVVSYSLPFEGDVSRDELLAHLHVHPKLADAVPFVFKYYERDWGLCCSQRQRDALTDDRYRVVIRSAFSMGSLKVGEAVAKGRLPDSIVLCAHLCHPAMANDDLAGVAVGLEVMRRLQARRDLRFTYRLLLLPETIGSVAWLSHNEAMLPLLRGGLFLEMLGTGHPHALQRSFAGNTWLDRLWTGALQDFEPEAWTGAFRTVIGNDERQFNAPGVRVPMLSLSRVLPAGHPDWPYRDYHASTDTPDRFAPDSLDESVNAVLRLVDAVEQAPIPINRFKGEIFCSRFGIHRDFYQNPAANRALFDVMYLIDGTRSVAEIAHELGVEVGGVDEVLATLGRAGLVDMPQPHRDDPS